MNNNCGPVGCEDSNGETRSNYRLIERLYQMIPGSSGQIIDISYKANSKGVTRAAKFSTLLRVS